MLHNKILSYLIAAILITQGGKIVTLLMLAVGLKLWAERMKKSSALITLMQSFYFKDQYLALLTFPAHSW